MPRTSNRPLPANQVHPSFALFFGLLLSILGLATLYFGTNLWAFILTLATLIIYLCLYTPLKKKSAYATEIGAVSGALPPLIGWVSASGEPSAYGLILFGILCLANTSLYGYRMEFFAEITQQVASNYIYWGAIPVKLCLVKVFSTQFY